MSIGEVLSTCKNFSHADKHRAEATTGDFPSRKYLFVSKILKIISILFRVFLFSKKLTKRTTRLFVVLNASLHVWATAQERSVST